MDLTCTNPNYILYNTMTGKITFKDKQYYHLFINNDNFKMYKTRCNNCLACRLYKGYTWSNRLQAEAITSKHTYFLTLTYNDESYNLDYLLNNQLRDIQLFIKRLRKKYDKYTKIKYYATSELGGNTLRYHYHVIIFTNGLDIMQDKRYYKDRLWRSQTIDKLWTKGGVIIAIANQDTIRYTCNYVQDAKNTIAHCYSKNLGIQYIKEHITNNMYWINGHYSILPKKLKNSNTTNEQLNAIIYQDTLKGDDYEQRKRHIAKRFGRKKT
jgi:hypothetical protein